MRRAWDRVRCRDTIGVIGVELLGDQQVDVVIVELEARRGWWNPSSRRRPREADRNSQESLPRAGDFALAAGAYLKCFNFGG